MKFQDRKDAGQKLAKALSSYKGQKNAIVIGLPRGGVVVAHTVAEMLNLPLDIIAVAKISAPQNPELAIGAIANSEVILDRGMIHSLHVSDSYLEKEMEIKGNEVKRRLKIFRKGKKKILFEGKVVIIIDDGIATGSTMMAAIESLKRARPQKIILAVPVAPPENLERFQGVADEIISLIKPDMMMGVGEFYIHFDQVDDAKVSELLS